MLNLNHTLDFLGVDKKALAIGVGVSRPAISTLCNKGLWPAKNQDGLRSDIKCFLKEKGASAVTLAALFNRAEQHTPTSTSNDEEDNPMLLRKQPLHQATKKHFGLFANPFDEINDAEEVYTSPDVRYVRAALEQTIHSECYLAIVGESGAGKSVLRCDFIDRINRESRPVIVIEPFVLGLEDNDKKGKTLKAADIASAIIRTLNPQASIKMSAEARYAQLYRELRDSRRSGQRHVLIIEEAHGLSIPTLKHLKRFYELKDGFNRLLSVVLIGQTELGEKLAENRAEVREVVQRIEQIRLEPLDNHLEEYLSHRLNHCNKKLSDIITLEGLSALRSKLIVPARDKRERHISLLYPLAVGNQLVAAMNLAAELGAPTVSADIIAAV